MADGDDSQAQCEAQCETQCETQCEAQCGEAQNKTQYENQCEARGGVFLTPDKHSIGSQKKSERLRAGAREMGGKGERRVRTRS